MSDDPKSLLDDWKDALQLSKDVEELYEEKERAKSKKPKKEMLDLEERLEITSIIAPKIRELPKRNVKLYDQKTGAVTGESNLQDVVMQLDKTAVLEFGVEEDKRPDRFQCKCGRWEKQKKKGQLLFICSRCRTLPCAVCGEPSTKASSSMSRSQGFKPYCEKHVWRKKPLLPCVVCGEPSTRSSSSNARKAGTKPYCEKHKQDRKKKHLLPCAVCGEPSTKLSSANARRQGGCKAYCEKHKQDSTAKKKPLLPCVVCGEPSTKNSSAIARSRGYKPRCANHPRCKSLGKKDAHEGITK